MLLVIEDEEYRKDWFTKAFDGQEVHFARQLNQVLDLLRINKYDIIFLDYDLDCKTDGLEIAQAMAYTKLGQDTPVIIHSDNESEGATIEKTLQDAHFDAIHIPIYKFTGRNYWLYGTKDDIASTVETG